MRVLLADDESNVRYGLGVLLEERSDIEVVGEAADAEDLLAQVEAVCPDQVPGGRPFWKQRVT
jgi:DNA-binding NarL/FixJ family response regulator